MVTGWLGTYRRSHPFIVWLESHPQPHPEYCGAWGWSEPLDDEALSKCTCGLAEVLDFDLEG